MTDSPIDSDLEAMAGGRRLADAVKKDLERLRDGVAGPDLAEMARDLLEGRTTLRAVAQSSAYSSPIAEGVSRFKSWEADLSPEERERFEEEQRRVIGGDISDAFVE